MQIRYATQQDMQQLAWIEMISYPQAESASKESMEKRVTIFPNHFWVLEEGGTICAFINGMVTDFADLTDEMYDHADLHNDKGKWQMIFSVATAPQHRGKGYAGAIMKRVISDARRQNRAGIVLTCKARLLGFYSKFGFENEGISKSTHGGATWYQMRLIF